MLRPADWWTRLKDPVLNQLVADAIGNNTDVATAKARIREARATFAETSGRAYPDGEGSANYMRSRSAGTDSTAMTIGLKTSWDLDLFGGQRRASEAAWYSVLSADERLHAATVALIGDLVTGYADLRGAQARIAVARRNAGSQQQTVRMTRDRLAAGEISQLDLLNAETQAETTAAEIPDLRIQVARALNRLALLSGHPVT
jgi:outer membrane protein TolC